MPACVLVCLVGAMSATQCTKNPVNLVQASALRKLVHCVLVCLVHWFSALVYFVRWHAYYTFIIACIYYACVVVWLVM